METNGQNQWILSINRDSTTTAKFSDKSNHKLSVISEVILSCGDQGIKTDYTTANATAVVTRLRLHPAASQAPHKQRYDLGKLDASKWITLVL